MNQSDSAEMAIDDRRVVDFKLFFLLDLPLDALHVRIVLVARQRKAVRNTVLRPTAGAESVHLDASFKSCSIGPETRCRC